MTQDHDDKLFAKAMEGVKPLKDQNKIPSKTGKKITTKISKPLSINNPKDSLSNHETEEIQRETYLSFYRDGVQIRYFRKLQKGTFTIKAELDLHRKSIDEARTDLLNFISSCQRQGLRVIRITHGKGYRSTSQKPILKGKIYHWLKQLDTVLAFCSCQPRDGGTGAVYVLLRRLSGGFVSHHWKG